MVVFHPYTWTQQHIIYYYRYDLTDEQAYDLGRRAIYHATFRDAASGGIVRVYHMKPTGYEIISEEDCKDLHYRYAEEKKWITE